MMTTSRIMIFSIAMIIVHTWLLIPKQRQNRFLFESKSVLSASVAQMISLSHSLTHSSAHSLILFRSFLLSSPIPLLLYLISFQSFFLSCWYFLYLSTMCRVQIHKWTEHKYFCLQYDILSSDGKRLCYKFENDLFCLHTFIVLWPSHMLKITFSNILAFSVSNFESLQYFLPPYEMKDRQREQIIEQLFRPWLHVTSLNFALSLRSYRPLFFSKLWIARTLFDLILVRKKCFSRPKHSHHVNFVLIIILVWMVSRELSDLRFGNCISERHHFFLGKLFKGCKEYFIVSNRITYEILITFL